MQELMEETSEDAYNQQLLDACENGGIELVKQLLTIPMINVNVKDKLYLGLTPLIYACIYGYYEIVELLLNDGRIKINLGDDNGGQTAFYLACQNGRTEIVKLLLSNQGVDIHLWNSYNGFTPLMMACLPGHLEVVKYILVSGREIDVNVKEKTGKTAIEVTRDETSVYKKKGIYETEENYQNRIENYPKIIELLESFEMDPNETRRQLRRQLGIDGNLFIFLFLSRSYKLILFL